MSALCRKILALGRLNFQMSWCKCPGFPPGQTPGIAADKCIIGGLHMFKKNLKVSVYFKIKNHRNNLLFRSYKLGFRCFELKIVPLCFDLKDLNLDKPRRFERLRKLELTKKIGLQCVHVGLTSPLSCNM